MNVEPAPEGADRDRGVPPRGGQTLAFDCRFAYPSGFELHVQFETDAAVTALTGASGSGKTTVLNLIAGLLHPAEGKIRLGDETWVDSRTRLQAPPEQRRLGVLFQDYCLFPHLTVRQNIEYGWRRQTGSPSELEPILSTLELDRLLERYPPRLSGGEQQRVALARALACGPRLLLLDEPLTSVEIELRDRIAELIERVHREFRVPMLLVSHNRALIDHLAGRVIELKGGRLAS